jgi:hypothetical protein
VQFPAQPLPHTECGQLNIVAIDNTAEILATYTTQELEELLQFIETKEGRFENLKHQLKEELVIRIPF